MLDLTRLREQFSDFNVYQAREQALRRRKRAQAGEALADCAPEWEALGQRVERARPPWLVAAMRERPDAAHACGPRPTPVTVVATDGSQVYPDRHVEPSCYLLNVSRIAFQYGTTERPLMEAVPAFRYRQRDLEDHFDEVLESATADVVSAIRDEYELEALLDVARAARMPGRPLVAIADGTLIRWMLRGRLRNRALEERLVAGYTRLLEGFRADGLPLCSYISMPANTEVVNLLRVHRGEAEAAVEEEASLAGLLDRWLFEDTLEPGQRSALFESSSHIQQAYQVADRICYFYLRVPVPGGSEIGRVELPGWVADDPRLVELVHAVVLSECEKAEGYPMILAEAHERAVIRTQEKAVFYEMIEHEMLRAGLPQAGSQKAASKRRPIV